MLCDNRHFRAWSDRSQFYLFSNDLGSGIFGSSFLLRGSLWKAGDGASRTPLDHLSSPSTESAEQAQDAPELDEFDQTVPADSH